MYKSINFALVLMVALIAFSCEKKSDSVIDPSYDSPVILSVTKSTDTVSTTSASPVISFDLSAVVSENGGSAISSVNCTLIDPLSNNLGTFSLDYVQDLGNGKKYGKTINAGSVSCLLVGNYSVQVIAKNEAGLFSAQVNSPLYVKNTANMAPVISGSTLPDSVVRPVSGSFDLTISIDVTDADGRCDIKDVYFDAYRPSGSYIGVIPMTYFSNNEWRFTNPVLPAPADSSYGYFKYHFFAGDRSNVTSAGVWDSIKFVRP
ncbi:MAG: hypothetical protein NTY74_04615 [Ignavibacteriae bacterium]|nr:hypothetical protein [Ignavibacteriota bacterium]